MSSALLASIATWLWFGPCATRRLIALDERRASVRKPSASHLAMAAVPVAGLMLIGGLAGLIVGMALAPVVGRVVGQLSSTTSRRHEREVLEQLPTALDLMSAALAVGRPPIDAFTMTAHASDAPLGPELRKIAHRLAVSSDHSVVWSGLEGTALSPVARAFIRAETAGIPIAAVVSTTGEELRRARRSERRSAGARVAVSTTAPLGLCFLPSFFLVAVVPALFSMFTNLRW